MTGLWVKYMQTEMDIYSCIGSSFDSLGFMRRLIFLFILQDSAILPWDNTVNIYTRFYCITYSDKDIIGIHTQSGNQITDQECIANTLCTGNKVIR